MSQLTAEERHAIVERARKSAASRPSSFHRAARRSLRQRFRRWWKTILKHEVDRKGIVRAPKFVRWAIAAVLGTLVVRLALQLAEIEINPGSFANLAALWQW